MTIRPNCDAILSDLKDFQRKTVDYVFRRLYTDPNPTRRFLVADEVGLGKTMVARGIIAKTIDHLWESVPRIDILYICSNSDIAAQNINRLNCYSDEFNSKTTRITLLPSVINDLANSKVNFISLTPETSFKQSQGMGIGDERALLYLMLRDAWSLPMDAPECILAGNMDLNRFRHIIKRYGKRYIIDPSLKERFLETMEQSIDEDRKNGKKDIETRFKDLCFPYSRIRFNISEDDKKERARCISELRSLLARSCIDALEPDLIILDEFQRFKHLLSGEDPARELAEQLFSYSDENSEARVLLLSATPYKMYTTADESGTDDHYLDFLNTLEFLHQDPAETEACKSLLNDYRRELFRIADGDLTRLLGIRDALEQKLRRIMVRNERLAVSKDRNGMLTEIAGRAVALEQEDLLSYCTLQQIAEIIDENDSLEYWKSSPYLLNFMEDYRFKRAFDNVCETPEEGRQLSQSLASSNGLLLSWKDIADYKQIDPLNARLRSQLTEIVGSNAWKLLWIPPALPYYEVGPPFSDVGDFTKRLVFSSWKVVPKMMASLMSYEAERRMIGIWDPTIKNTPEARKRFSSLLRFSCSSDGERRLTGMPVLGIIYPSLTLARECDPLKIAMESKNRLMHIEEMQTHVRERVERLLAPLIGNATEEGPEDENWYWAAPILLDKHNYADDTKDIFVQPNLANIWKDNGCSVEDDEEEEEGNTSLWHKHVSKASKLIDSPPSLGRPPRDLSFVITQMALAGPGVSALRALARITGGLGEPLAEIWNYAAQISWSFLHLFNLPGPTYLIRGLNSTSEGKNPPYWRMVLEYCVNGCLQATLDEYAHFLKEYEGLINHSRIDIAQKIASAIGGALSLRTVSLDVKEVCIDEVSREITQNPQTMRTQFALRLGGDLIDEGKSVARAQVRRAFNSPFWPFVLITTSIGQEGLDFHPYCHAVVHWNLPANPVDLEQREGRIHRYKGHAIRKNLAQYYGFSALNPADNDPWEALFKAGVRDREPDASDLVPYWIFPTEDGAKIERHVPSLPLSRDMERLDGLHHSLTLYRMVFGQTRQEDLISFLRSYNQPDAIDDLAQKLKIDLSPPG